MQNKLTMTDGNMVSIFVFVVPDSVPEILTDIAFIQALTLDILTCEISALETAGC